MSCLCRASFKNNQVLRGSPWRKSYQTIPIRTVYISVTCPLNTMRRVVYVFFFSAIYMTRQDNFGAICTWSCFDIVKTSLHWLSNRMFEFELVWVCNTYWSIAMPQSRHSRFKCFAFDTGFWYTILVHFNKKLTLNDGLFFLKFTSHIYPMFVVFEFDVCELLTMRTFACSNY